MRFLVDECTGSRVAQWLRAQGHEVFSVYDDSRGISDDQVILKAVREDWILITNDKDFGQKIFRERHPHRGVIFLRLEDERAVQKIECLQRLLGAHSEQIRERFVVVSEKQIRFAGG